jgi:hypothetical protein
MSLSIPLAEETSRRGTRTFTHYNSPAALFSCRCIYANFTFGTSCSPRLLIKIHRNRRFDYHWRKRGAGGTCRGINQSRGLKTAPERKRERERERERRADVAPLNLSWRQSTPGDDRDEIRHSLRIGGLLAESRSPSGSVLSRGDFSLSGEARAARSYDVTYSLRSTCVRCAVTRRAGIARGNRAHLRAPAPRSRFVSSIRRPPASASLYSNRFNARRGTAH